MIDMALLATSAVAALVELVTKAAEKGMEKAGEEVTVTLVNALKKRLSPPSAKEAIDDLAKAPTDPDVQAALRLQLRKAMEADPAVVAVLQDLVEKHAQRSATTQTAAVTGNQNAVAQIVGNNNTVGGS